jgi:HD-like signal output (HDOD) protein
VQEKKKFYRPPTNTVYVIDGASFGLDDDLVEAVRSSIQRRLESKTLEIPRLPQVAGRIMQLSRNPDTTIDDVVAAISTDPLLATRIVTVANSVAYGNGNRIDGLKPALMRLGSKAVQDMVFAESIRLRIFSARSYLPLLQQSWQISLGAAIACEALSQATGLEKDGAFLMGLLHDTGKPVLVSAVSECERQNKGMSLGQEKVEILMSQLHEEIGAYVLKSWQLSPSIVAAAGSHHRYLGASRATPAHSLIYASNLICQHLGIGETQRDIDFTVEHVFADLKLADWERMTPILESVGQEVERLMVGLN